MHDGRLDPAVPGQGKVDEEAKAVRQIRKAAARGFNAKADSGMELSHQHQLPLPPDNANVQFGSERHIIILALAVQAR